MRYVESGRGPFPLISLVAILSISLVVNLPGLAISPLLGDLDKVFPGVSHLEIQLLTILPNLFILPFLLLSGKLSLSVNKLLLLKAGLWIYTASAVLYFFATSMLWLIVVSCLLGIGAGMVIPLAAGLVADYFTGKYRMKQLGVKSGIANFTLIFATLLVGWLGNKGWHLPFIVYLVPAIPLLLSPFMSHHFISKYAKEEESASQPATSPSQPSSNGGFVPLYSPHPGKLLAGLIALYFTITYAVIAISYYLPFTMQHYRLGSTDLGLVNSFFFLSITLPGFFLPFIILRLKGKTILGGVLFIAGGLFILGLFHALFFYILGASLIGLGYGIIQPIIYDKATYLSPDKEKATQFLSFIFCGNYVAITVSPFIMALLQMIFGGNPINMPFIINGFVALLLAILVFIFYKSTLFRVDPSLFKERQESQD